MTPAAREKVIEELVTAMSYAAMEATETNHASVSEVVSAYITLTARLLEVVKEHSPNNMEVLRAGVAKLWDIVKPDPEKVN